MITVKNDLTLITASVVYMGCSRVSDLCVSCMKNRHLLTSERFIFKVSVHAFRVFLTESHMTSTKVQKCPLYWYVHVGIQDTSEKPTLHQTVKKTFNLLTLGLTLCYRGCYASPYSHFHKFMKSY